MNQPIVLTNGEHEVKIYAVRNRGRLVYQLSFHEGGKRERKTFGKVSVARREAKLVLNRLAVNGHDAAELSTADMESSVVAKKHADTTDMPVHVCTELFAKAHSRLKGRGLLDAVDFFVEFNRGSVEASAMPQLIADFTASRQAMGVHADYVQNIKRQLGRLVKDFPGAHIGQYRTAELDRWLGSQGWQPVTKNDVRKILITFGNWAKARGHLPLNRPTESRGWSPTGSRRRKSKSTRRWNCRTFWRPSAPTYRNCYRGQRARPSPARASKSWKSWTGYPFWLRHLK